MTQASIGHHCPTCLGQHKQEVYTPRNMPGGGISLLHVLIGINLAAYLGQIASPTNLDIGWLWGPGISNNGEWWRVVTSAFLHGSLIHIGLNMYMVWMLGNPLLEGLGKLRFALMYTAGLLGGSFAVLAFNFSVPTLGASGAVLGLGGALAAALWARGISITQTSLGFLIAMNLALPLLIGGISFWGHFGGVAAGFAAGWLVTWLPQRFGQSQAVALASVVGLCLALVGGIVLAVSSRGFNTSGLIQLFPFVL